MLKRILGLVVAAGLLVAGLPSFAQGDMTTFTSPDGSISFDHPADLVLVSTDGGFLLSNMAGYTGDDLPAEMGDDDLIIAVLPPDDFGDLGMASAEELVTLLAQSISGSEGAVETMTINDRNAAQTFLEVIENPALGAWVVAIDFDGNYVILMGIYSATSAETFAPVLLEIAASLSYSTPEPVSLDSLAPITLDNVGGLFKVQDYSNDNRDMRDVALNADNSLLAMAHYSNEDGEYYVDVITVADGEVVNTFALDGYTEMVYFTAEGNIAYALDEDAEQSGITVLDVNSGEVLENRYTEDIFFLKYTTGDQLMLASAGLGEDGETITVTVRDIATDEVLVETAVPSDITDFLAINADASQFLISRDATIALLNTADGTETELFTFEGDYPSIEGAAFSPDGSVVVVSEYTNGLHMFSTETNELLLQVGFDEEYYFENLQFNADGTILYGTDYGTVWAFDAATLEKAGEVVLLTDGAVQAYVQSNDGRFLVGGAYQYLAIGGVPAEAE